MSGKDPVILLDDVAFRYPGGEAAVLGDVSLEVHQGEFVAVAGENGSGKSTLCRLLDALLLPTSGRVLIGGRDTADEEAVPLIRRTVGLIINNPDNQIVGPTLEDDVAFGLENLGVPPEEIGRRVAEALEEMGLAHMRNREPHLLSLGEKKRLVLAGVLACRPRVLVSDEGTSMLDPPTRENVLEILLRLHREEGLTIVHATHDPLEMAAADRLVFLEGGRIAFDGDPEGFFFRWAPENAPDFRPPPLLQLVRELATKGFPSPRRSINPEEVAEWLASLS